MSAEAWGYGFDYITSLSNIITGVCPYAQLSNIRKDSSLARRLTGVVNDECQHGHLDAFFSEIVLDKVGSDARIHLQHGHARHERGAGQHHRAQSSNEQPMSQSG